MLVQYCLRPKRHCSDTIRVPNSPISRLDAKSYIIKSHFTYLSFIITIIKCISISGITNFPASDLSIFKQWFITKLIHHRYRIQCQQWNQSTNIWIVRYNLTVTTFILCHLHQTNQNKTKQKTDAINKLNCVRESFAIIMWNEKRKRPKKESKVVCGMVRIDWNVVHFAYNAKQEISYTHTKWRQCALSIDNALKYMKKIIIFVWNENKSYIILDTRLKRIILNECRVNW